MPRFAAPRFSRAPRFSIADVLPIFDFVAVVLAAYASSLFSSLTAASAALAASYDAPHSLFHAWSDRGNMALIGASLATYLLYDQNLASLAVQRKTRSLVISLSLRAVAVVAMIVLVGYATALFDNLSQNWLFAWLAGGIVLIAPSRVMVVRHLRRNDWDASERPQEFDLPPHLQFAVQRGANQVRPTAAARDATPLFPCAK